MVIKSFQSTCQRIRQNQVKTIDKSFYYRYCRAMSGDAGLTSEFANALSASRSLVELTVDGGILRNHESSVHQHLAYNVSLQQLSWKWLDLSPEAQDLLSQHPSLKMLELTLQRPTDIRAILSSSSIETLEIQSLGRVHGLELTPTSALKNLKLKKTRLTDKSFALLCQQVHRLDHLQVQIQSKEQAVALGEALASPRCSLSSLDLSYSNLRQGAEDLLQGLQCNTSIQSLNLNFCSLGKANGMDWRLFSKLHVASLSVGGNFLSNSMLRALLPQLPAKLVEVDLQWNIIDHQTTRVLLQRLESSQWKSLLLSGLEVADPDAPLLRGLARVKSLQMGALRPCHGGDLSVLLHQFVQGLQESTSLQTLRLENYGSNPAHVQELLMACHNLAIVSLFKSSFDPQVCNGALAELLRSGKLQEFCVGKANLVDQSTVEVLAQAMRQPDSSIKKLRVYQCPNVTDWDPLYQSLCVNQKLRILDLHCSIATDTSRDIHSICENMPHWKGLHEFTFHGPGGYTVAEPAESQAVLQALEKNYQLRRISVQLLASVEAQAEFDTILHLNRCGRRFLQEDIAPALLPTVLSKMDSSALWYSLRNSISLWTQDDTQQRVE